MRRTLSITALSALLSVCAVLPASSQNTGFGTPLGELYLSASPTEYDPDVRTAPFIPFSVYLVAKIDYTDIGRPELNAVTGIQAWEASIDIPGLGSDVVIQNSVVRNESLNVGSPTNVIAGLSPAIFAANTPTDLVEYTMLLLTNGLQDVAITIGPATPSSFTPARPGYAESADIGECTGPATGQGIECKRPFALTRPATINCIDECEPTGGNPSVSEASIDFGPISLGDTSTRGFILSQPADAGAPYEGAITETCDHYSIVTGEGTFSLDPGDSLIVEVEFAPTTRGRLSCSIGVGDALTPVACTGEGVVPDVSPASLDFGIISVNGFTYRNFVVSNPANASLPYTSVVTESCSHYFLVQGGGPFTLAPGESRDVTVRFLPTAEGVHTCSIDVGPYVGPVECTGEGVLAPECFVSVDSLEVPPTVLGHSAEAGFFVTNLSGGDLIGDLQVDCPDFELIEGGGPFSLVAGDTLDVRVRFTPTSIGPQECVIAGDDFFCTNVIVTSAATTAPAFVATASEFGDGYTRAVSWIDHDNDGDEDLYLTRRGVSNLLFENRDNAFIENTPTQLRDPGNGFGSVWIDQNNDGHIGLIISNVGEPNVQILNEGHGFVAINGNEVLTNVLDSRVIAPADYDRDGLLDLFVVQRTGGTNLLLHGAGDGVGYLRVPSAADESSAGGRSANWVDIDDDGYLDLYLVNSTTPCSVYRNDSGTLVEMDVPELALDQNNTDSAWGDYDNDGDLDVYVTTFESPNRLIRNEGNWQFTDVTVGALGDPGRSGPPSWIDVDLDGDLDLHFVNGPGADRLFINEGGTFHDASFGAISDSANHAGAAWSDYDGDGDPDVALANWDAGVPSKIVRNENSSNHHWVGFDLHGLSSNRFGIGARVSIVADGHAQCRWLGTGHSGKARAGNRVMFGLGTATVVDSVEIRWPSGIIDVGVDLPVDQVLRSSEGGSVTGFAGSEAPGAVATLRQNYPNPFNPTTTISFQMPESGPYLIRIYSAAGRLVDEIAGAGEEGDNSVVWTAKDGDLASGVYIYKLKAGDYVETKRMVLLK